MSYVYHVYFSQYLADGSVADGDATLTLSVPIEYVSDLALVKRLILELRPGRDAVIKSWRLLCGEQRPTVIPSRDGMNDPRVEGPLIGLDTPKTGGEPFDLMQPRTTWFPLQRPARRRDTLFPPLPRPQTVQEWADLFRDMPARIAWPGRSDESGLDALAAGLRYSPELQARGASMNATLLDSLDMVRTALDRASVREFAADTVEHLAQFIELGLVPEAAVKYLKTLASAVRQADARHLVEAAQ
jgi:hypothetical protein